MRAILTVASNDLLRVFKQRETFLFGLLMPGIMMLLLGVAMGGGEDTATITIDVLDEDSSALSAALVAALRAELELDDSFRLCVLGADDGDGCAVSAAPLMMAAPAPTIAFSPSRPTRGSVKCIEPPLPLLQPVRRPSSSAIASFASSPLASDWPCPR